MNRILKRFLGLSASVLLAVLGSTSVQVLAAEANWLEVHLVDKQGGAPLADAAVCVGTSARPDQYGARRTDANGVVRFDDVRPHPLVVITSKTGFQGRQQILEPLYQSRVLVVTLATGGGGPECDAPLAEKAAEAAPPLVIEAVRVRADMNAQPAGVLVSARVAGKANQIRVSEQADFAAASWQSLSDAVPFELSEGKGLKQIYVQVRRASEVQGASIEVKSPVKKVSYRVN
jgi:hypothetical protein